MKKSETSTAVWGDFSCFAGMANGCRRRVEHAA